MIFLASISIKFIVYAIVTVAFTIFIGFKFLKFNSDLKKIEKKVDFLRDNPMEAKSLAFQLNTKYFECTAETEEVFSKLSSLKYQKDFGSHTVYLCMEIGRTDFLIISVYEYLNTKYENATEVLYPLNFRININHVDNLVQVFSDENSNELLEKAKNDFIQRFLITHCNVKVG